MKRFIKIYLVAVSLLTLGVGCNDKPFSGIIVDKEYIPVHRERRHRVIGKVHSSRTVTVPSIWIIYVANRYEVRKLEIDSLKYLSMRTGSIYKEKGCSDTALDN